MRVLHVSPYFPPARPYGGPPQSVLGLCQGLQRAGVQVEVVTTTANGRASLPCSPPGGELYDGVPVQYAERAFPRRFFGGRVRGPLRDALARADVCHIHGVWNVPEWWATYLARKRAVPYVISPRGMLQPQAMQRSRRRKAAAFALLDRRNLAGAALLHATSEQEAEAIRALGFDVPIAVVPNGVDLTRAGEASGGYRARLGIPGGDFVVLFLGRMHRIKRLDLLADAFVRARASRPAMHLVLAGPDEDRLVPDLLAGLAGHADHVHALDAIHGADKWALLKDADVMVQCSDSESFGLSVAESLASGVPVIATRTCPWSELEARECGLWVEQTAEAVAAAILALADDPERRARMGTRATAVARDLYSWDALAPRMARLYKRISHNVAGQVVVLTPNLCGRDGISRLARLVTATFDEATVLALHEPRAVTRFGAAHVRGADGRSSRFVAAALRAAASSDRQTRVIVTHLHLAPAALAFAARGASLTAMLCGVEAWRPLTRLQRAALDRAARLIAISRFTRDGFQRANARFAGRVEVCHLGVEPLAAEDQSAGEPPSALIVGRMAGDERYKGHDSLLDIWSEVAAAVPGASLRVVGDGDDRPRLEQKAAALGLGSRVAFLGRLDDEALRREYQRCTAFVMPSRDEGFGFVFVEAMRAARACIAGRGAAAEIIADGETGLLVDPGDRSQLLQSVVRVLRDRAVTEAMGARGRARFLHHFTEEQFRNRFTALLPVAS